LLPVFIGQLYAVTFSEKFALAELLEYTKDDARIYTPDQGSEEQFLRDVGHSILGRCSVRANDADGGAITLVPNVEAAATPAPANLLNPNLALAELKGKVPRRRQPLRGSRVHQSAIEEDKQQPAQRATGKLDQIGPTIIQLDEAKTPKNGENDGILIGQNRDDEEGRGEGRGRENDEEEKEEQKCPYNKMDLVSCN
jgi:hypothetical protein